MSRPEWTEVSTPLTRGELSAPTEKTPWFSPSVTPVRDGWYEVKTTGWRTKSMYWHGGFGGWHGWIPLRLGDGLMLLGLYPGDAWRGLAQPQADHAALRAAAQQALDAYEDRFGSTTPPSQRSRHDFNLVGPVDDEMRKLRLALEARH